MSRELYSKTKLASELGVDRRTLDARLDGLVPAKEGARNAKLYYMKDVFNAFLSHAENEASKARRVSTPEEKTAAADEMASARLRKELAEAEMAEMKADQIRGDLVDVARVETIWGQLIGAFKAKLLALPSQASVQVEGLTAREIETELEEMVREALAELSLEKAGEGDEFEEDAAPTDSEDVPDDDDNDD